MDGTKILKALNNLNIPKWFPDYDINLFHLAFMPRNIDLDTKYHKGPIYEQLKAKYPYQKDLNYNVLEFYGDTVLYMIMVDIFREFNGTRNTLFYMDKVKKNLTTNKYIRSLSHKLKVCDTVYGLTPKHKLELHNHCSDSFEAILGALFFQYGLPGMQRIRQWYIETFPDVLNEIRKRLAPYMYIPVRDVSNSYIPDTPDIIARFHELNPRCEIKDIGGEFVMYIDGLEYDRQKILEDLIPIIYHGK